MCLIKGKENIICSHNWCRLSREKPQYFGISIAEFYNTHEFSQFTVSRSSYGHPHIIPKNPNPDANDGFEFFRQSMTAVTHLAGSWPAVDIVKREHIEFRFAEHIDNYPVTNYETGTVEWKKRLDVAEYAFYIGPIDNTEMHEVDVNAVFELPEILKGERDLTHKDWCHCGSEGDWCGEGCYQPQKPACLQNNYYCQSTAVASWYDVIGENTIADALLDRMVHTSYRIELKGESLRKKK